MRVAHPGILHISCCCGTGALLLLMFSGCPPNQPPLAEFQTDRTHGNAPLTIQFQDLSLPGGQALRHWEWDFGDGSGSTEQSPAHTYETAGPFSVRLTVRTSVGESEEFKQNYIQVSAPGVYQFQTSCYNAGIYPITELYITPIDAETLGANLLKTPLDSGQNRAIALGFPPNLYIVAVVFSVEGAFESLVLPGSLYALALLDSQITISPYWNSATDNGIDWAWGASL